MNRAPEKSPLDADRKGYLSALRFYWVGSLVILFSTIGVAGIVSHVLPRTYVAHAAGVVRVSAPEHAPATDGNTPRDSSDDAKAHARELVQSAATDPIASRAITIAGLTATPAALRNDVTATLSTDETGIEVVASASSPNDARKTADAWIRAMGEQVNTPDVSVDVETDHHIAFSPLAPATVPLRASSPDVWLIVLIGLLVGVLLALIYPIVRDRFRRPSISQADFEEHYGVPLVGVLPHDAALARASTKPPEESATRNEATGGKATLTESLSEIVAKLMTPSNGARPRTIVVTSPLPGAGTSTVATRLARAIAHDRQPVILVDGNLRDASHEGGGGVNAEDGFTNVIDGTAQLATVLREPPGAPFARLLAAGSPTADPKRMIASSATKELIDSLSGVATVVIDAPPTSRSENAALFASQTSGAVLVAGMMRAADSELTDAIELIRREGGTVLGVVLTKRPIPRGTARTTRRAPRNESSPEGRRIATDASVWTRIRSRTDRIPQLVERARNWQQERIRAHRGRSTPTE